MRTERHLTPLRAVLAATAFAVSIVGLSACGAATDAQNSVVGDQIHITGNSAVAESSPKGPDSLDIAQSRLDALVRENQNVATELSRAHALIKTISSSSSCERETKSCEKKLTMLKDERARLTVRSEQLPRAVTVVQTRIAALQAR